jgi:hypothetical protein
MLRDRFRNRAEQVTDRATDASQRVQERVREANVRKKLQQAGERVADTAESREERSLKGAEESAHAAPVMDATLNPITSPEDVHHSVGGSDREPMSADSLVYASGGRDDDGDEMSGIDVDSAFFGTGDDRDEDDDMGVLEF